MASTAKRGAEATAEPAGGRAVDTLQVTPLGSGSEVGRSCILLDYKGARVLLDCGIHPGLAGIASLPFFDEVDLATVDVLLVTHFHLDHCAAVPFLVAHTPFKGRIFMTHATKAIYGMLLADFVKLNRGGDSDALFSDADLAASMARIETVDYHQVVEVVGIRITPYAAGHVLGAAMFQVDIAGLRVLYTGDYSRKADRHLPGAETPPTPPHVLIVESTYGVATHSPKDEREKRFTDRVVATLRRGGRVLLPIVALGRAQELLLILEDYWEKHPELQHIPVWQASGLARRSLSIYQTYIGMLNADMQAAFERANPFALKHVKNLVGGAKEAAAGGPCVVLATPSMLQTGLSRELFEAWAGDARNGVIIADFAVAGTLARDILGDAKTVTTRAGVPLPILCSVDAISFSAHADFPQTSAFVAELAPPHVVLVHGEAVEMGRLKRALEAAATADGRPCHVYTPRNCQPVAVVHKGDKVARVLGRLADEAARAREAAASSSLVGAPPAPPPPLRGLLVPQGFGTPLLLHPDDVEEFTGLEVGAPRQRQTVAVSAPFSAIRFALEQLFDGIAILRSCASPPREGAAAAAAAAAAAPPPAKLEEGESGTVELAAAAAPAVKLEDTDAAAAVPVAAAAAAAATAAAAAVVVVSAEAGGAAIAAPAAPAPAPYAISIGGRLTVTPGAGPGAPHVVLTWVSDPLTDMVADATLATLLAMEGPPPEVAAAEAAHAAAALEEGGGTDGGVALKTSKWRLMAAMLGAQFGPGADLDEDTGTLVLGAGEGGGGGDGGLGLPLGRDAPATVSFTTWGVACDDEARCRRVEKALGRVRAAVMPLPVPPPEEAV